MMNVSVAAAFLFYCASFFLLVYVAGRTNLAGRIFCFFVLFYSIIPFYSFSDFQFFSYKVDYQWNVAVFLIYGIVLLLSSWVAIFLCREERGDVGGFALDNQQGLVALWGLAFFAWIVDISFNWNFFFLPKNEYILSIPEQTKNLFLFTIPAKEILVGAVLLNPFKNELRKLCILIGCFALMHSLIIGVRHVALLFILLLFLPKLRSIGILILCIVLTVFGEISNILKLLLSFSGTEQSVIFSYDWLSTYFESVDAVSVEQKAILSNLLIKLENPEFFEFNRFFKDVLLGLPLGVSIVAMMGLDVDSAATALTSYVVTLEGEGTAYSFHLVVIESMGLIFIPVVFSIMISQWIRGSFLLILSGEIFYSTMRNGADYWISQMSKLMFLCILVVIISAGLKKFSSNR